MKQKNTPSIDLDEQKEGVSYEKGRAFEEEFALYMKYTLMWDKVRVGAHMQGHNNPKGTSIDILGERLDYLGIKYKAISNKWMMGSGTLIVLSFIWHMQRWGHHGMYFLIFSLMAFLGVATFRLLSDFNNKQNVWVECKNLKSKVDINHVSKMIREMNDYKLTRDHSHRFTHFYFASANGYVENALKMAHDNGITCFVKNGDSFQEVKYWK